MKSLVSSLPLRVLYILVGGLPAHFLSVFCLIFGQDAVWAISHTDGTERVQAVILTLVFALGILGTLSGWFAFFSVGTSSVIGRTVHSIFISGGVVATALFEWDTLQIKGVAVSSSLVIIGPAIVGCCLLFHLWRNNVQGSPSEAPKTS